MNRNTNLRVEGSSIIRIGVFLMGTHTIFFEMNRGNAGIDLQYWQNLVEKLNAKKIDLRLFRAASPGALA
jgi:hypothetical protein